MDRLLEIFLKAESFYTHTNKQANKQTNQKRGQNDSMHKTCIKRVTTPCLVVLLLFLQLWLTVIRCESSQSQLLAQALVDKVGDEDARVNVKVAGNESIP